jgi:outer membrane protein TolC
MPSLANNDNRTAPGPRRAKGLTRAGRSILGPAARGAATTALSAILGGCGGPVPAVRVADRASAALGPDAAGAAVLLRVEGLPDDLTGDRAGPLTLPAAMRQAIESSPRLQQALARVRAAEAGAVQARLLPNPVATLVVRFREGGGSPVVTPAVAADLANLLRKPREAAAADHELRAAAAEALAAALDAAADARKAYAEAQAQDALLAALRERLETVGQMVGVARARVEAGAAARLDLLTLDGQRVAVEQEIADAEPDRQTKRLALLRVAGQPSADVDRPLDPWRDDPPAGDDARPAPADAAAAEVERGWVNAALRHRPEVEARRWDLAALGDRQALAAFFPWDKLEAGAEAERDVDWSVGPAVSVPLPVFDRGDAAARAAFARRVEARHKLAEVRRQVIEEARRGFRTYAAARASVARVRDALLPIQARRREQVQGAYQAGEVDLATLLLAENDLHEAREKLVEQRRKAAVALIDLQRAAGGAGVAVEPDREQDGRMEAGGDARDP